MSGFDDEARLPLGALRRNVSLEGGRLIDGLTGHVHRLPPLAYEIASALEGGAAAAEATARLTSERGLAAAAVERELRRLVLLGLLEGSCELARARLAAARAEQGRPPSFLPGTRLGCRHSGACCRGYVFSPVREREVTRIEALAPRAALPYLPAGALFERIESVAGEPTYRLATVGDACVFLDRASRCGLHGAFGADAKPAFCRMFPLAALPTIDGLKIYDRGECASFAPAALTGTPIEEILRELGPLVAEASPLHHPVVTLHGSWRCDYSIVLALARRLDEEARTHSPLAALHAMGHVARGLVAALARCPLQRGEPEATVSAVLARPFHELRPPPAALAANTRVGLRALAALADALAARVAPDEPFSPPFLAGATLLSTLAGRLADGAPADETTRKDAAASLDHDAERALTYSLRQQIYGGELLLDDHLPGGLLRIALVVGLTLATSAARAADAGRATASLADLSVAHMIVKRTLHRPEPARLVAANGEQAWPVLDAIYVLSSMTSTSCSPSSS